MLIGIGYGKRSTVKFQNVFLLHFWAVYERTENGSKILSVCGTKNVLLVLHCYVNFRWFASRCVCVCVCFFPPARFSFLRGPGALLALVSLSCSGANCVTVTGQKLAGLTRPNVLSSVLPRREMYCHVSDTAFSHFTC